MLKNYYYIYRLCGEIVIYIVINTTTCDNSKGASYAPNSITFMLLITQELLTTFLLLITINALQKFLGIIYLYSRKSIEM